MQHLGCVCCHNDTADYNDTADWYDHTADWVYVVLPLAGFAG